MKGYKMISKNYSFKIKCDACSDGVTSDRHPIDPSAQDVECWECEGKGWHLTFDDMYSSKTELLKDYPDAYDIQELNERFHRVSVKARSLGDVIMDAKQTYWSPKDA
tara:strand:+ start:152 stop:472 length:321 start_codon:yes stop_codon:yes gene_type:complete